MIVFKGVSFLALLVSSTSVLAAKKLPDGLMLGAGSSAFQIEGGWDADGKGPSQWDVFVRDQPVTGDVAADSYHKWREDVENVKRLGLDFYRFSISWPRILPNGTINYINQKGVDYYMNIIKALKAEGIEPIITIYHWDMPQHLNLLGGFLNPQIVDYFEDYARLVFTLYGPYVKYWLTINEPLSICKIIYGTPGTPGPALVGDGLYQCSYTLLKAHARAYRIYDEEFRAKYNGKLSIVLNTEWREPASNSSLDLEAQERALQFVLGWFANPIYIGNWPQVMIDRIGNRSKLEGLARSRLPQFTQEEIDYIKGTHDFFAFNTYGTQIVTYQEDAPISYPDNDFDMGVNISMEKLSDPLGHRKLINYINERYHPKSIMNTENGFMSEQDTLDDNDRVEFLKEHISSVIDTILIDNINVIGYSVWSLMDDFEWPVTYSLKYGLIRVDFDSPNRTRTWKNSAKWYQNLTATRILDD